MIHYNCHRGLSDLPDAVMKAIRDLTPHASDFDSIVVQGVSRCLLGSPVAIALSTPLMVVRKDADLLRTCQHVSAVENARNAGRRVLFLDDYVGEGKTLRDVNRKLARYTAGTIVARYEALYGEYTYGQAALLSRC